jgi:hypothetical protein
MQQDSVALRVVMRVGYALANPASAVAANRFPFATLVPKAPAGTGAGTP